MATARPMAVAISASEIPGATAARAADCMSPMAWKEFMMPQTVPNRPINGVALALVARNDSELDSLASSWDTAWRNTRRMLSMAMWPFSAGSRSACSMRTSSSKAMRPTLNAGDWRDCPRACMAARRVSASWKRA